MKVKTIKITKEQKQYSDKCPVCSKIIKGTSESQVKYNMKVHCMQIHNILVDIKKLKDYRSKNLTKDIKKELK